MISILALFLFGSMVISGSKEAGQDVWITIIIGTLAAVPLLLCYARILKLFPSKGLFEIVTLIFGRIVGKIIIILYTFYTIQLGGFVIRTFSEFIKISAMPETPQLTLQALMILICIWMAKSGIECIGRVSRFALPLLVIVVVFTLIIFWNSIDLKNIQPVLGTDLKVIGKVSVIKAALPFCELILLASMFSSFEPGKSPSKAYLSAAAIASGSFVVTNIRNVLILGTPAVNRYYFPSYEAVSVISLGEIFTRIEVLIGISYTLAGTIKTGICIYIAALGISKISGYEDIRPFVAPSALIMLFIAGATAENAKNFFDIQDYYPYFAMPFQLILPVVILIAAEIKVRITKNQTERNSE